VPRALICSHRPLTDGLQCTVLWRQDVERCLAVDAPGALGLARRVPLDLMLVDAEMPGALDLVRAIRTDPSTRRLAVAVLARHGAESPLGSEFRFLGATDVLAFPPGTDWNERLLRLLPVAPRREVRHRVGFPVEARGARSQERIAALDLSVGGMLIECARGLDIGEKLRVRFSLARGAEPLVGTAYVARKARASQWGLEFLYLDGDGLDHLRRYVH
jgi:CheY-like chemotaxis protein